MVASPVVSVPALALISALLSAAATILIRHGLIRHGAYTGLWINLIVGTVCLWAAVLFTGGLGHPTPRALLLFALAGLIGTVAGRLTRFMAIETVGASITAGFMNLTPFVSSGLAIVLLGEQLTWPIVVGTCVIVLGTTLLSTGGRRLGLRPAQLVLPAVSAACFGVVAILRKLGLSGMGGGARQRRQRHDGVRRLHVVPAGDRPGRRDGLPGAQPRVLRRGGRGRERVGVPGRGGAQHGRGERGGAAAERHAIFVLVLSIIFLRGIEALNARVVAGTALVVLGAWLITALGAG